MEKIGFLFDLDGVLIDSEREYTRIWNEIDKTYPSGKKDFSLSIKGQTLTKILNDNYPEELREEVYDLLHLLEKEMKYDYCPHAEQFLDHLVSRGAASAVVTSSDEIKMAHLYNDLPGFRSRISTVIDASKVKKSKPDPEGYLLGAKAIGKDIRKCVVFEDSVQGVKAGRAAGAFVVGITGTKKREDLLPYSDIVVDSLAELSIQYLEEQLSKR